MPNNVRLSLEPEYLITKKTFTAIFLIDQFDSSFTPKKAPGTNATNKTPANMKNVRVLSPPMFNILFERSEFLIDTYQKKSLRVCTCARVHAWSTNLGFSVWYYVPHTYVPGISSLSARYQDTYMYLRMCQGGVRTMCHICS